MKSNQAKEDETLSGPEMTYDRPSRNEVRRWRAGSEDGTKRTDRKYGTFNTFWTGALDLGSR
jgi:hypothetical protein